jgi:uncharacterized membrane protein (DUF106 family)
MHTLLALLTAAVDAVVRPLAAWSPAWLLALAALVLAVPTLLAFRRFSDQERLRTTKNRIKAHILELWLFRDDVRIVLGAQGRLLGLNARYLALTLPAMVVIAPPMLVVLGLIAPWYEARPLRPGEPAIVSVHAADPSALAGEVRLVADHGVVVETPPLHIPAAGEIDWRIRAVAPGVHTIAVEVGGSRLEKHVVAAAGPARVSPSRTSSALWQVLFASTEPPLPGPAGIERIEVRYPAAPAVWGLHWIVFFFIAMVVFVFALRRPLRVEV